MYPQDFITFARGKKPTLRRPYCLHQAPGPPAVLRIPARNKERARGTPGRRRPMTLCTMSFECTGGSNHGEPTRPAFRARCLRLAPRDPRWDYHFRSCLRPDLPTAMRTHGASGGRSRRMKRRRKSPVTRGQRAGTSQLGPPWRALRTPATATAPANPSLAARFSPRSPTPYLRRRLPAVPALERPRARPRMGRGEAHMRLLFLDVKEYFHALLLRSSPRRRGPPGLPEPQPRLGLDHGLAG